MAVRIRNSVLLSSRHSTVWIRPAPTAHPVLEAFILPFCTSKPWPVCDTTGVACNQYTTNLRGIFHFRFNAQFSHFSCILSYRVNSYVKEALWRNLTSWIAKVCKNPLLQASKNAVLQKCFTYEIPRRFFLLLLCFFRAIQFWCHTSLRLFFEESR